MLTKEMENKLIQKAIEAYGRAYAPYSHYSVGAALVTDTGEIFTGVNIENAVYPLGICGERTAIFKAVSEGFLYFQAIVVVTRNGGTPCGSCRQVMAEFGLDTLVLIANTDGELLHTYTVAELLPKSFGEKDLN
jgi:cytidine deaminase